MRTRILILMVLLASGNVVFCQSEYGLKGGINVSNQSKSVTFPQPTAVFRSDSKPMLGYQAGAFYKRSIGSRFNLAAEVGFSIIGSRNSYVTEQQILNPDGKTHYYNNKLGYIEIPLTLQYGFNHIYFGVGPGIAYKVFSGITNLEDDTFKGVKYRQFDLAGNLLLGCKISSKWDANLRYSYGLLNVLEDRFNQETKNRFLNLSFLYFIQHR